MASTRIRKRLFELVLSYSKTGQQWSNLTNTKRTHFELSISDSRSWARPYWIRLKINKWHFLLVVCCDLMSTLKFVAFHAYEFFFINFLFMFFTHMMFFFDEILAIVQSIDGFLNRIILTWRQMKTKTKFEGNAHAYAYVMSLFWFFDMFFFESIVCLGFFFGQMTHCRKKWLSFGFFCLFWLWI